MNGAVVESDYEYLQPINNVFQQEGSKWPLGPVLFLRCHLFSLALRTTFAIFNTHTPLSLNLAD